MSRFAPMLLALASACAPTEYDGLIEVPDELPVEAFPTVMACEDADTALTPVMPNVHWVVDASGSMAGERWETLQEVVTEVRPDDGARLGLSVFPTDGFCAAGAPMVGVTDAGAATAVEDALWSMLPAGATPMGDALEGLIGRRDLQDPNRDNIVVLLTDGIESCDGDPAGALRALVGQEVPVQVRVVGIGTTASTDVALQALADLAAPTTPDTTLFHADTAAELAAALREPSQTCRFDAGEAADVLFLNGQALPRCNGGACADGFRYDARLDQVELVGAACEAYLATGCAPSLD